MEDAARSLVCLHATDPATVYLSAWARVPGMTTEDLDRALYVDRSLVKHLAMRRTLFVFPRASLSFVQAATGFRVSDTEIRRLVREVEKAGLFEDAEAWFKAARAAVLEALQDGREATSSELRDELPLLEGRITFGVGKTWGGEVPIGPRVLTTMSAAGEVVRASNDGGWTASRPRWTTMSSWLGEPLEEVDPAVATATLVGQWLTTFGPGTARDIKWWLGSTMAATRRALVDVGAVEVDLDGQTGYVLPDDVEDTDPVEPWAALLPSLDSTTMGWFERAWYLGEHRAEVFDSNGNGGSTAWWDGRIVGGWHQDESGTVVLDLLEEIDPLGRRSLEAEAFRLTEWLAGVRIAQRFPSPLSKRKGGR